ncbi:hypothetical protein [Lentzea flaviverrucosa]|uniref:hypothetical protein n=1 Tax=Lentzea flaviverrucosa TaxID=200379 RepID=UPI0014776825|nr:hypothetical protein [Lentzea flaviverrucosa]
MTTSTSATSNSQSCTDPPAAAMAVLDPMLAKRGKQHHLSKTMETLSRLEITCW